MEKKLGRPVALPGAQPPPPAPPPSVRSVSVVGIYEGERDATVRIEITKDKCYLKTTRPILKSCFASITRLTHELGHFTLDLADSKGDLPAIDQMEGIVSDVSLEVTAIQSKSAKAFEVFRARYRRM